MNLFFNVFALFTTFSMDQQRGNIHTRLRKLDDPEGPFSAIILASAGLRRMGMQERITCTLGMPSMLYAVGQGALGIEIRSGDERVKNMVSKINHWPTAWTARAERALLRALEGGCSVPVGAHIDILDTREADQEGDSSCSMHVRLDAIIANLSGNTAVEANQTRWVRSIEEAEMLGTDVADDLIRQGGKEILASLGRKVDSEEFKLRHQKAVQEVVQKAAKTGHVSDAEAKEQHCGWMTPAQSTPGTPAQLD